MILVKAGGSWRFRTAADLAPRLRPALAGAKPLPEAVLEVLAAVAIYGPVMRPEIERAGCRWRKRRWTCWWRAG